MSHYTSVATLFRDPAILAAVLREEFGANIEVHAEAEALYGWRGDMRSDLAHIIIRRKYVGVNSNDIGFVRGPDGIFRAIVSEYDSWTGEYARSGATVRRDQAWLNKLAQRYAVLVLKAQAAKLGYKVAGEVRDAQGNVRLVLEV